MTAVLVAVGLGTLAPTQVKVILESQDPLGKYQARVAPARGLFLKSVLYNNFGKRGWDWKVFPKAGYSLKGGDFWTQSNPPLY